MSVSRLLMKPLWWWSPGCRWQCGNHSSSYDMMSLLDDSIPYLDAILHDELVYDANLDVLLLANSNDVHSWCCSSIPTLTTRWLMMPFFFWVVLSDDDSTLLMGCPRETPNKVAQSCCRQSRCRGAYMMSTWCWFESLLGSSLLMSYSRCDVSSSPVMS